MAGSGNIRCFTCGLPTGGHSPRFNTLETGELCPACRERVLEAVGPALPHAQGERRDVAPENETPLFAARLRVLSDEDGPNDRFPGDDYDGPVGA